MFQRIGEATDVVTKEMYDFVDKGGRHVALRPELTASGVPGLRRAPPADPVEGLVRRPNFRYEKPQRGRYRQFDQVGIEVLGADDPYLDVEVIALGWEFYRRARPAAGDAARSTPRRARRPGRATSTRCGRTSRPTVDALSERAARRSSATRCACSTPSATQDAAADRRRAADRRVLQRRRRRRTSPRCRPGCGALGIPFAIDAALVRGLDYYRRTTFEFQGGTLDSAQNALGGGGRYDGLVEELGGPPTPGIGFALGLDRTLLACDDEGVFAAADRRRRRVRRRHHRRRARRSRITDRAARAPASRADRAFDEPVSMKSPDEGAPTAAAPRSP